jgi:hypothetical protein
VSSYRHERGGDGVLGAYAAEIRLAEDLVDLHRLRQSLVEELPGGLVLGRRVLDQVQFRRFVHPRHPQPPGVPVELKQSGQTLSKTPPLTAVHPPSGPRRSGRCRRPPPGSWPGRWARWAAAT